MLKILSTVLIAVGLLQSAPVRVFTPVFKNEVRGKNLFPQSTIARPRIGLVLSGGGARGIAHIGVLAALDSVGIPIDLIVGTSIGAVIGGLYAAGYTPQEIEVFGRDINWHQLFSNTPNRSSVFASRGTAANYFASIPLLHWRPILSTGYSGGQKLTTLFTELLLKARYRSNASFDNLKVPFRAVSTNLGTGNMVVHSRGNLSEVIRASMSVPLFFTPIQIDSMLLVDGGLVNCIPVDVAQRLGVDIVIAVDLAGLLRERDALDAPIAIADQVMSIMMKVPNQLQREQADILIQPPVGAYLPADFGSYDRLISIGHQSVLKKLESIQQKIQEIKSAVSPDSVCYTLGSLTLKEGGRYTDTLLAAAALTISQCYTSTSLQQAITRVYATGLVDSARLTLLQTDSLGITAADIRVVLRPYVANIAIRGGKLFSPDELLAPFAELSGVSLHSHACERAAATLREKYRHLGFSLMTVDSVQYLNDTLCVHINEGIISRIALTGNKETAQYVILRAFPRMLGDVFNSVQVARGIRNVVGTGLFSYVNATVTTEGENYCLHIQVQEKPYTTLRLGLRFDLNEGAAAFTEIGNNNLLGSGMYGGLQLHYGEKRRGVLLQATTDRMGTSYFSGAARLAYRHRAWHYTDYVGERHAALQEAWEAGIFIGSQIRRLGHTELGVRYLRRTNWFVTESTVDEIKGIRLRTMVNTLNRSPFPQKGKRNTFVMDVGQSLREGDLYVRMLLSLEAVYRCGHTCTIHPLFAVGTGDGNMPFSERFFMGGWAPTLAGMPLPGYAENELWGRNIMLAQTTMRYKIYKTLHIALRVAAGYSNDEVYFAGNQLIFDGSDFQKTFLKKLYSGVGCGVGVTTPLGPMELGYGLGDRAQDHYGRAYVHLGYLF